MRNPLVAKLERCWPLGADDFAHVAAITAKQRLVPAREDIVREGEKPQDVHLVVDGLASRYKLLPNGRRSIMAYLLPGDFCDLRVAILNGMDHGVVALTPCSVVDIPHAVIHELLDNRPRLARALWRLMLADESILREWLVNMGQHSAEKRLAHLLCELRARLSFVGMARDNTFKLPLTQEELGQTLGISTVHVNRVLQHLRASGLVRFLDRTVMIPEVAKLEAFAEFDPRYLHLETIIDRSESALSATA